MNTYETRVVLHDAKNWDDYNRLHNAMEAKGFYRTITASNTTYHMPPAEYIYVNGSSADEVMRRAKAAAESTGFKFGVWVVQINLNDAALYGLKPAA